MGAPGGRTRAHAAFAVAALATALALTGCTAGTATDADAPSASPGASTDVRTTSVPAAPPEPTPALPAYTVEQLRQTVSQGYPCTTWTAATLDAGTGGWCQESMIGIFVFPDQTGVEAVVARSAASSEPQPFLVGNRWLITTSDPASEGSELIGLQDVIGGSLEGESG
ncbi:hypothetical protein [Herbiconiux sp.]|uniref:hypothetical protein n=1 Tax=Herbiconiux sp. TaxID=1871186 RepID=UPI0025B96DA1|nr:hypothetical protein [Herbiconiux sp.]